MGTWNSAMNAWLERETRLDDDPEAELRMVFAALPDVRPSPDFAARAARAAWSSRTRSRRVWTWAAACGLVGLAVFSGTATVDVPGVLVGWLSTGTLVTAEGIARMLMTAATGATLWSVAATTGSTMAGVVMLPQGAAVLVAMALTSVTALYLMRRLLRGDVSARHPGSLCF